MKILIVEDNPASLKLVAEVLESSGMEVVRTLSAEEALARLDLFQPDLLLTDIILPGIDGLTLTRKLKTRPETAMMPIVAMTANALCDEKLARDAGCEALISKPIDTRQLAQQLIKILHCAVALQKIAAGEANEASRRDPGAAPLEVLVVEDDPSSLKLTATVLMQSGYLVSVAASAEQAIATIELHRPDVIVLDLGLPSASGLDFVRALRRMPDVGSIPILAITAYPQQYEWSNALKAGCDGYIIKPIDTRRLPRQVQALVNAS